MECEGKYQPYDWTSDERSNERNAARAFRAINEAYHKANPTTGAEK